MSRQIDCETCTRLYCLEPEGIGTSLVEGLSSYIARLAEQHRVKVSALLSYECGPLMDSYMLKAKPRISEGFFNSSYAVNSGNSVGQKIAATLNELTGRSDIYHLTMYKWRSQSGMHRIIKDIKTWCPLCYADWLKLNKEVYDPLLWSLLYTKICSIHEIPLSDRCPHCGSILKIIHPQSRVGHCYRCHKSLVNAASPTERLTLEEMDVQKWITRSLGELLMSSHLDPPTHVDNMISIALESYRVEKCDGNYQRFAEQLQFGDTDIYNYCTGRRKPNFPRLLWICYVLNASLSHFLNEGKIQQDANFNQIDENQKSYFQLQPEKKLDIQLFNVLIPTVEACYVYLYNLKWPSGFICPKCSYDKSMIWRRGRATLYRCLNCKYNATVTSKTIFHNTQAPLRVWLCVIYLTLKSEKGIQEFIMREFGMTSIASQRMIKKVRLGLEKKEDHLLEAVIASFKKELDIT
jgi:Zn ribbon nucleic-acid-binding protein